MMTIDGLFLRLSLAALSLLALSQMLAGCSSPDPGALGLSVHQAPDFGSFTLLESKPDPEPTIAEVSGPDPRSLWCEPLDQPFCTEQRDCMDGTRCVTPWWAVTGTTAKVCARPMPDRAERRWRADRLRVMVDRQCSRSSGCEPNSLHAYLRILALRESTWRPWKRHRLDPDLDAARSAWSKHADKFAGNQAAANPERFSAGIGMYGMIPALWLPRWDPMAPPEVLCGEVEATEAHLRAARDHVRKVARGVDCDGDGEADYWGSAENHPSWYDVSRTNSGKLCPGSRAHQDAFEARARRVGLDPWAPVGVRMLATPIEVDGQDAYADSIRTAMDELGR